MEFVTKLALVAAGGSLGAVARYLVNISPLHSALSHFPLPTFLINISGSFMIGLMMVRSPIGLRSTTTSDWR